VNFRQWLNEDFWSRAYGDRYNPTTGMSDRVEFPIYKNPSPQEFQDTMEYPRLSEQRVAGLLMVNGDVYIWPRDLATHHDVLESKGLYEYVLAFYVFPIDDLVSSHSGSIANKKKYKELTGLNINDWKESPRILHMLGD